MKCPQCGITVSKPAAEGGVVLRNRYVRVTAKGEMLIGCPGCGSELETKPAKLVLYRTRVSAPKPPEKRSSAS